MGARSGTTSGGTEWFVERMGLAAEADGFSRIAGRLFGLLLLSAEPRSLDELAGALGVSKASVSIEARRLLGRGVLARVGKPADRRDYYALAPDFFSRLLAHRVARWTALHELVLEMRTAHPAQAAVVRQRFDHVDAIHALVTTRIADALREWTARTSRGARPAAGRSKGRVRRGSNV